MGPVAPNEIESDKEDDKFKKLFANNDDNKMPTIDQKREIKDLIITRKSEDQKRSERVIWTSHKPIC